MHTHNVDYSKPQLVLLSGISISYTLQYSYYCNAILQYNYTTGTLLSTSTLFTILLAICHL